MPTGALRDVHGRRERHRRRGHGAHDLDEAHDGGGIEEVESDDVLWPRGHRRELDHGQAGGGRREDGTGLADLVEVLEERSLDADLLDDCLDDEVRLGQRFQGVGAGHPGADRIAVGRFEFAALHCLLE